MNLCWGGGGHCGSSGISSCPSRRPLTPITPSCRYAFMELPYWKIQCRTNQRVINFRFFRNQNTTNIDQFFIKVGVYGFQTTPILLKTDKYWFNWWWPYFDYEKYQVYPTLAWSHCATYSRNCIDSICVLKMQNLFLCKRWNIRKPKFE